MNEIQIIITGNRNVGKSTMILLLEKLLKENGFNITIDRENEIEDYRNELNFRKSVGICFEEKLNAIKTNTKITLKSKQMYYRAIENQTEVNINN